MRNIHVMPIKGHVASPRCHCKPKKDKQQANLLVHTNDWLGKQIAKLPKGRQVKVEKLAQLILADNRNVSEDIFQLIASGRVYSKWVIVENGKLSSAIMFANRGAARRLKSKKTEKIIKALVLLCG